MAITYYDNKLGESLSELGKAAANRINEKNIRAKKLAEDPATLQALAASYRAAKKVGQEKAFFAGLQVDQTDFEPLLQAYPETAQEKYQSTFEDAGGPKLKAEADVEGLRTEIAKTKRGQAAIASLDDYVSNLPDTPLGNHLKEMARMSVDNEQFLNEIRFHETADLKGAKGSSSSGSSGGENPMIAYGRWRTAYNDALKTYRESGKKEKVQAARDLNELVLLGESMQQDGTVPPFPITGVREAKKWFGLGKKLEEYSVTPEVLDAATLAAHSVITGQTPDGTPVTLESLQNSPSFKSFSKEDQAKTIAAITASQVEPDDTPSYWDMLGSVAGGLLGNVNEAATGAVKGAGNLAIGAAESAIRGAGFNNKPKTLNAAEAPKTNVPISSAPKSKTEQPVDKLATWAEGKGFTVTSRDKGEHNRDSTHYKKLAIDIRTLDKTETEIERIKRDAILRGLRVLDERRKPPNQKVWGGPHLHIEIDTSRAKNGYKDEQDYINSILSRLDM